MAASGGRECLLPGRLQMEDVTHTQLAAGPGSFTGVRGGSDYREGLAEVTGRDRGGVAIGSAGGRSVRGKT